MPPSDESPGGDPLRAVPAGELRIARDGTWFHEGRPIRRMELVKLFATVLKRDEAGNFWLRTPVEACPIIVEDAPFTAVELSVEGQGERQVLRFRSNLDLWVEAGPEHPLRVETDTESGAPRPYIQIQPGPAGGLEALVLRTVFYQLVEVAVPGRGPQEGLLGVWSRGVFFALGPLPPAEDGR